MLLTDEVRAHVGRTASYRSPEPLGQASIRYFALATGDDPARWQDVAPPTLVCETCQVYGGQVRHAETGYLGHSWDLPFAVPTRLIRGGNEYTFLRPVTAEDVITVTWTLIDLVEKPAFVVSVADAVYSNQFGVRLAVNRETSLHQPLPAVGASPDRSWPSRDRSVPSHDRSVPSPAGGAPAAQPAPIRQPSPALQPAPHRSGDLPELAKALDIVDLMAYGAATWDWHRLHYDAAYCRSIGLDGPIVDGQLMGALLARQVCDWAGPSSALQHLRFRNTATVRGGDVVRLEGRVVSSTGPMTTVEQVARVEDRVVAVGGCELMLRRG
jgi:acyl dehydratase